MKKVILEGDLCAETMDAAVDLLEGFEEKWENFVKNCVDRPINQVQLTSIVSMIHYRADKLGIATETVEEFLISTIGVDRIQTILRTDFSRCIEVLVDLTVDILKN